MQHSWQPTLATTQGKKKAGKAFPTCIVAQKVSSVLVSSFPEPVGCRALIHQTAVALSQECGLHEVCDTRSSRRLCTVLFHCWLKILLSSGFVVPFLRRHLSVLNFTNESTGFSHTIQQQEQIDFHMQRIQRLPPAWALSVVNFSLLACYCRLMNDCVMLI